MEFRTIKEDGQVQEEIKNPALSVMPSVFIAKKRLVTSLLPSRKSTTKLPITALPSLLGERSGIKRTSDDGEPSGTAGVPMLGVLENHNLTNVCVVVTRYFGGIKLGAGGLIRALRWQCCLSCQRNWHH